ncbi:threonylcarbamoyl-AMP synthase [Patescibacteria group bacterium]|nr:MAG: threonylcarbamoyl-AMP synthase [Patescibacteria group bacterium]
MAITRSNIRAAVEVLKKGGLVIYPTETAYALGCDSRNLSAVRRIYALKGRQRQKPLALIAAGLKMVKHFFRFTTHYPAFDGTPRLWRGGSRLTRKHWPGPLTLVLPVKNPRLRRALGAREVGVRVSPQAVARALSKYLGAPIVATSANRSGKGNCYSIRAVRRSFGLSRDWTPTLRRSPISKVVFILDSGHLPRRRPSTVVAFRKGKPIVLRQGPIRIS